MAVEKVKVWKLKRWEWWVWISILRNWDEKEKIKSSPCLVEYSELRKHFLGWGNWGLRKWNKIQNRLKIK